MNQYRKWASRELSLKTRLLTLISAGILFVLFIPYTLLFPVHQLDLTLHFPTLYIGLINPILGIFFILVGGIYGYWSITSQLFFAQGTPLPMMPTQKLLTTGPFKQCRNPMTFGTIVAYLGIGFIIGSLSVILLVLLFSALLLTYIKLVEEKELEVRFGKDYLDYKAMTPFLIPRIVAKKN